MDAQLKAKWVEALRSGKYEQAKSILRDGTGARFCCLGVLCDISEAKWLDDGSCLINDELQDIYLSPVMLESIALSGQEQEVLWRMNDDGAPFAEIADHIEANL